MFALLRLIKPLALGAGLITAGAGLLNLVHVIEDRGALKTELKFNKEINKENRRIAKHAENLQDKLDKAEVKRQSALAAERKKTESLQAALNAKPKSGDSKQCEIDCIVPSP